MLLSIVIPAYNEGATIHEILALVASTELPVGVDREIIIVNDCSTDGTVASVRRFVRDSGSRSVRLISHVRNRGKGAAIRTGFSYATGDYIVIQDADLEYDPREYSHLLQPLISGRADVVYGSRFMGGKPHRILFFWHSIGNQFLTLLSNLFTNLNLTDMETCYKVFKCSVLRSLVLREDRFGFEPEVTAKIARIPNIRIYEVGIAYYGRTYQEGKKIGWRDGIRAVLCILKYSVFASLDRRPAIPVDALEEDCVGVASDSGQALAGRL